MGEGQSRGRGLPHPPQSIHHAGTLEPKWWGWGGWPCVVAVLGSPPPISCTQEGVLAADPQPLSPCSVFTDASHNIPVPLDVLLGATQIFLQVSDWKRWATRRGPLSPVLLRDQAGPTDTVRDPNCGVCTEASPPRNPTAQVSRTQQRDRIWALPSGVPCNSSPPGQLERPGPRGCWFPESKTFSTETREVQVGHPGTESPTSSHPDGHSPEVLFSSFSPFAAVSGS